MASLHLNSGTSTPALEDACGGDIGVGAGHEGCEFGAEFVDLLLTSEVEIQEGRPDVDEGEVLDQLGVAVQGPGLDDLGFDLVESSFVEQDGEPSAERGDRRRAVA